MDTQGVECINNCDFRIPFSVKTDCTIKYCAYEADYYALDDHETKNISIFELNDHYFDAKEEYSISIEGSILVAFHLSEKGVSELSDNEVHDLLIDAYVSMERIILN